MAAATSPLQLRPVVDEQSGALTYGYPIAVPPGRNGLTPDLKLQYSSQARNQATNEFGYGWNLSIPSIQRLNKRGTDSFFSATDFVSSLSGELAAGATGTSYVSRIDRGDDLAYTFSNGVWTATTKTGLKYTFGQTAAERQDDPSDSTRVYAWMLSELRDANGNYVTYQYSKDQGQIYPSKILYTGFGSDPGIFEVDFTLATRPDTLRSGASGFPTVTAKRVTEIDALASGQWVHKYVFAYASGDNGARSLLSSVTESGRDPQGSVVTLPATSLAYQAASVSWQQDDSWLPPVAFTDGQAWNGTQLADVNGDGLSDILYQHAIAGPNGSTIYEMKVYLHDGSGWSLDTGWQLPVFLTDGQTSPTPSSIITDVNGDGLTDIVQVWYAWDPTQLTRVYNRRVFINNGHGWTQNTGWVVPNNSYTGPGIQALSDVNGDGLPDFLYTYVDGQGATHTNVYRNTGSNWSLDTSWSVPVDLPTGSNPWGGVFFLDVDGDGLPDIFQTQYVNSVAVKSLYRNTGHGWALDSNWAIPYMLVDALNRSDGSQLTDVNGDGLVDLVRTYMNAQSQRVTAIYVNTGSGWTLNPSLTTPIPLTNGLTPNVERGVRLGDANGDGLDDILSTPWFGDPWHAYTQQSPKADLMTLVTNPAGGTTSAAFGTTARERAGGAIANPGLPLNLDVVKRTTLSDGFGHSAATSYAYQGGAFYYDPSNIPDHRFSGFASIARQSGNRQVTTSYHQGNGSATSTFEYNDAFAKIGLPYRVETRDTSGNLFGVDVNRYETAAMGTGRTLVYQAQSLHETFEGGTSHRDTGVSTTVDTSNGNLTSKIEYGEVTGNNDGTFTDIGSDKRTTNLTYASPSGAVPANMVGLVATRSLLDQSGSQVRETRSYYDGLALGAVTNANETKNERWHDGATFFASLKGYDQRGLVTSATDALGHATVTAYDSAKLYPATVTDALNHATTYVYDPAIGQPTSVTDPNGMVTTSAYDGFGRLVSTRQPNPETGTSALISTTSYVDTSLGVTTDEVKYVGGAASEETRTFFDGLRRPIQTRVLAPSGQYATSDTAYDDQGRTASSSLPYHSSGSGRTSATTDASLLTVFGYDALDRVATSTTAVGTTSNAYGLWSKTVTDPMGRSKTLTTDAYGRLVDVTERNHDAQNDLQTYDTLYAYDPADHLTSVTDADGNTRAFTYDALGNRTLSEDLHASGDTTFGTVAFAYDAVGNLTQRTNANGTLVSWIFDALNRPTSQKFASSVVRAWSYDACAFGVGRVCSEATSSATTTTAYDVRGLAASVTTTQGSTVSTRTTSYDDQGEPTIIGLPDGSSVKNDYAAGRLSQVSKKEASDAGYAAIVSAFGYAPTGQVASLAYVNGATTTNAYDASHLYRLTSKVTTVPGRTVQNLSYAYDAAGDVTSLSDTAATAAARSVTYTYDDLGRLLSATAQSASSTPLYAELYTYGPTGNLLTKSVASGTGTAVVSTYGYLGAAGTSYANPQAAVSISDTAGNTRTLSYDRNGDLTGDSTQDAQGHVIPSSVRSYLWNSDLQLTQSVAGSATSTYAYDASGRRLSLSDGTSTTLYPSDDYDVTQTATSTTDTEKHVFAGSLLVATVQGTGADAVTRLDHTDHLTGTSVATDLSGAVQETLDYTPYGSIRIDQKAGTWSEQRKFAGHEYDVGTGLSYMGARYYDPASGRFLSEDPVYLGIGTDQGTLEQILKDPQSLNSYAYARNNPLKYVDPDGKWFAEVLTGKQSFGAFAVELGDAGNTLYDMSPMAATMMDHPVVGGAVIGVAGGGGAALLAPKAIQTGVGALAGVAAQGLGDLLSGSHSGGKDYLMSAEKGAAVGYIGPEGILSAGVANGLASVGIEALNGSPISIGNAIADGVGGMIGASLGSTIRGVPGRLPNPGSISSIIGAHALQDYGKALGEAGVSAIITQWRHEASQIKNNKK